MNRRHLLAAVTLAGLFVAAGSIEFAGIASATNINVTATSSCVDNVWQARFDAVNTYTTTLHVTLTDPHGPATLTLAPGAAGHINEIPDAGTNTFPYTWSSPDGHLIGTTSGTLTRPQGCGVTSTTATPPTTTCAGAIPPRADCEGATTSTPPTVPPTPGPTNGVSTSVVATTVASSVTAPSVSTSPKAGPTSTTSHVIALPPAGGTTDAAWYAAAAVIVGGLLIAATRRGRRA